LGLATPAALVVGLGKASQRGILIRTGAALEALAQTKVMVFDKTGTLTIGKPQITDVYSPNFSSEEALTLAASLEHSSEHPLALAFIEAAQSKGLALDRPDRFETVPGQGIRASLRQKFTLLGNRTFLQSMSVSIPKTFQERLEVWETEGKTSVVLAVDFHVVAAFAVRDELRAESYALIQWLRAEKFQIRLLTGDRKSTAEAIGRNLGLDPSEIYAEVLPSAKEEKISELQNLFGPVTMVGDGVNDAPAMARASCSVSLLGGTDVALEAAQVTLMRGHLSGIRDAVLLSQATLRTIRQNLLASFFYNALGIPIAAGALMPHFGIQLSPVLAGAAMALSSLSVLVNSLRLRRFHQWNQNELKSF
ncbi:MAG: HAD-IC family P-type ATPase, partial [Bdellovibrionales bacterium]|nr:HAD-IC family P-type ATPase [Bdellovibrionales bacterium]